MPIRVKWDQYETALLIETFWNIEENPSQKSTYIKQLSDNLRKKAVNAGIEIDDVYRNTNGITMQLSPIAHAFFPERPTLTTSAMFEKMVSMYKEDRGRFDEILLDAKKMIESNPSEKNKGSRKEAFEGWLHSKLVSKDSIDSMLTIMEMLSTYCIDHKISKKTFWNNSRKEFQGICNKLLSSKAFRTEYRKDVAQFVKASSLYKDFLELEQNEYKQIVKEKSNINNEQMATEHKTDDQRHYIREDKERYFRWLIDIKGVSEGTAKGYVSAIKKSEEYARENISENLRLFSSDRELIRKTVTSLFESSGYREINERQHNRYVVSIRQYLEFMNVEIERKSESKDVAVQVSKEIKTAKTEDKEVLSILEKHYPYGFNHSSPIELLRFRKKYSLDFGKECEYDDEALVREIKNCGFEYDGKVYVISMDTIDRIEKVLVSRMKLGFCIFYYDCLYEKNESWMFEGRIISQEMMKSILEVMFPSLQYRNTFFVARSKRITEHDALVADLVLAWGNNKLRTVDQLLESLSYVPVDKIKYALSTGAEFIWNSVETYALKEKCIISEDQRVLIEEVASQICNEKGSVSIDELPTEELSNDNFELSETAITEIVTQLLGSGFVRNGKVFTIKGEGIDTEEAIKNYCLSRDTCTKTELEQIMKDVSGELRYPIVVEAANAVMVRVDYDNYVSDDRVKFDISGIDQVLENLITGNAAGMKEITAFGAFPYCGYQWNWFLLESFCRRFSRKFKYDCATPNSKNAGAIVKKEFEGDYHQVMAESVARSGIKLEERDVLEYLVSSGLMIKRQYSDLNGLINLAAELREGRL